MAIFRQNRLIRAKIAIVDQYLALRPMTAGASSVVIYERGTGRKEQNRIVGYVLVKSKAEVTYNKRLRSRYCTVEATDRHEHRAASLR